MHEHNPTHWAAGFSVSNTFVKEYAKRRFCFPNACFSFPPISLRNKLYLPNYQFPVTAFFPPSWLFQIQILLPHPFSTQSREHGKEEGQARGHFLLRALWSAPPSPGSLSPWLGPNSFTLTLLGQEFDFRILWYCFKPQQFSDILAVPTAHILAHSFKERWFPTTTGAADEAQPPPKELPNIWYWTRLSWCLRFPLLGGRNSSFLDVQSHLMPVCIPAVCVCVVVVVDLASSFFLLFISYFHWGCYPYKLKSQMTVYQAKSSNLCFGKVHVDVGLFVCLFVFFLQKNFLSAIGLNL